MQSVPRAHMLPSALSPPSWQCSLPANSSPPLLKGERHVFSQMAGGGGEVELSDRAPKIVTMLPGGTVAAPTLFSAQRAASHLSR